MSTKVHSSIDRVLASYDARREQRHPNAEAWSTDVWRVCRGSLTLGWVRYTYAARGPYALYFDGTDDEGRQAWCRSFDSFGSAVAWAVQHAGWMSRRAQRLGASRMR